MDSSLKAAFEHAARENYWSDPDSVSGPGSNHIQTAIIKQEIPRILEKYKVKSMIDAPCGDMFWMRELLPYYKTAGIEFCGIDIVAGLIQKHTETLATDNVRFLNKDITREQLPKVDLIFTRDCFIHLSFSNILAILKNHKASGSKYMLVSTYTFPNRNNYDVQGFYLYGRMLNLQKFPFYLPKPLELINEGCTEGDGKEFSDKSLGLWDLQSLSFRKFSAIMSIWNSYRNVKSTLGRIKRKIFNPSQK